MSDQTIHDPLASYDAVADEYASRIAAELQHKPFDRQLLDQFADRVRALGAVADIGCGPGHVGRYLLDRGVRVVGIDLSSRMIQCARRLNPTMEFQQADMTALPSADATWEGIVAFYSLIHVPQDRVVAALREFRRVLRPRGLLLVAFHIGADVVHLDEWWGHRVAVDFVFFRSDEMESYLAAAGFEVELATERDPYPPEVEHQSRRGYILARAATTARSRPTSNGRARTEPRSSAADDEVSTAAERASLDALRRATGGVDTAMERHCVRVFLIIERIAADQGIAIDREVALCASYLFEIGAYPLASTRDVYTSDGRRFAKRLLEPFGWPETRLHLCLDAIERHHQLRSQHHRGAEVELLRRADLVDAFPAFFRFGLSRAWLADLFRRLPRRGLYSTILSGVGAMLRERPATIPRIFLSPRHNVQAEQFFGDA